MSEQITAVRELLSGGDMWTAERVAGAFSGAKPADVTPVLESLSVLGLLLSFDDEEDQPPRWKAVSTAAA